MNAEERKALVEAIDLWDERLVRRYPEKAFRYMTALVDAVSHPEPTEGANRA